MKRMISLVFAALAMGTVLAAPTAQAAPNVCPAGDSGKIDTSGNPLEVTITAPEGFLIDTYCVKGGTTVLIVDVDPDAAQVTISLPSGKAVSHYSFTLVEAGSSS
jgi:hypothetical protein